jgi:hypothetical protein
VSPVRHGVCDRRALRQHDPLAVDQTGSARTDGPPTLQAIKNVEHCIANPADAFHSQTALLEKINAAEAIGLRLEEPTNQFLMSSLEQQLQTTAARCDRGALFAWRRAVQF